MLKREHRGEDQAILVLMLAFVQRYWRALKGAKEPAVIGESKDLLVKVTVVSTTHRIKSPTVNQNRSRCQRNNNEFVSSGDCSDVTAIDILADLGSVSGEYSIGAV